MVFGVGAEDKTLSFSSYHINEFEPVAEAERAVAVLFLQYATVVVTLGGAGITLITTSIAALELSQLSVLSWLT